MPLIEGKQKLLHSPQVKAQGTKIVFNFHKNCIFCQNILPENVSGVGEHVFPLCVFGFWRIYDVCSSCMKHFGTNIDHLPLKHEGILNAMEELGLAKRGNLDQLPYHGLDTIENKRIELIRRGSNFKVKAKLQSPDFFECSENDWTKIGVGWIEKQTDCSQNEFKSEIEFLKTKYETLPIGEVVTSDRLGISVRKRSVHEVKVDSSSLPSITPIIAKIAVSFLSYALPENFLYTLDSLQLLIDHARNFKQLPKFTINKCRIQKERKACSFHRSRIHIGSNYVIVDVTFFGCENWRIVLNSNSKYEPQEVNGVFFNGLDFILDFKDKNVRKKYLGVIPCDKTPTEFFEIPI